jgi:two-component system, OmpR family, sensor kinase
MNDMAPDAERNAASVASGTWQSALSAAGRAWQARTASAPWWRTLWQPRSLRLRLALWYGTLLALVLCLFSIAVLLLATSATIAGSDAQVRAEVRVATADLQHALKTEAPYWPAQLTLQAVDANRDPGTTVVVLDAQGSVRYASSGGVIHQNPLVSSAPMALPPGNQHLYTARVEGVRVRVEVLPIYAPGAAGQHSSPIGTLLVAKSLSDVDATLATLRILLVVVGAVAICVALVGGWAIAARVLHPLAAVAETASTIATATTSGKRLGGLRRRVPQPSSQDELAHLVDTFNTMLAALEEATAAQQRFVADASHELRAPLTTIQGNLALLLSHEAEIPASERHAMLMDAHAEALRVTQLVNELLALARADAADERSPSGALVGSQAPRQSGPVDLDRIVLDLVRQVRQRLAAEGSPLDVRVAHIEPIRVRGDEEALRRLCLILLDNALKYTLVSGHDAGREAAVTVSLARQNGHALLSVRDIGIGIDPADLPHIFERFYRADRARDRQGTGLGLSIAQAVAQQHGGTITVESSPGHGSTFTVQLPAAPSLSDPRATV